MSRRSVLRLAAAGVVVGTTAACTDDNATDELQVVENPTAAVAARSPETTRAPAGRVVPRVDVRALAVHPGSRTLAVAVEDPPSVRLYDLGQLGQAGGKPRTVALPAPAVGLTPSSDADKAVLAPMPGHGAVAHIALPGGELTELPVRGRPAGAAVLGERTLVAVRDRKAVEVFAGRRRVGTISGGLYSADDVLVAGGQAFVLDRLRTALFRLDVEGRTVKEGLRAGRGATNAVVDSFGRVLVTDTRGGGLLAFSTDPLLLRQRYPVPGGVYGIAYDSRRQLAWLTLTRRNEVVGFDVAGGEPKEMHRYPTVRQPNSVTVDERTARVVVGSAAGEGIQVIAL